MFLQCMSRFQIKCCFLGSETLIPACLLSFRFLKRGGVGMKKGTGGQSPLGLWVVSFVIQAVIEVGILGILQGRFVKLCNWVLEAGDSLVLDVLRPYFAEIGAHWGMSVRWWGWTCQSRLESSQSEGTLVKQDQEREVGKGKCHLQSSCFMPGVLHR